MNSEAKFWARVDQSGSCWPWLGGTSNGRGRVSWFGRIRLATHIAYELGSGLPVPKGELVRHRCDNPICVRPAHLVTGTQADNMGDAKVRGRTARGERHGRHKLTTERVVNLRHDRANGVPLHILALHYGISEAQASLISRGLKWPEAGGPIVPKDPRFRKDDSGWLHPYDEGYPVDEVTK